MYQKLQKFDKHWYGGGPSIAMVFHLRRVSDLLYDWKSCLLCYMKDVVLLCSIFVKWNKIVRVRVHPDDLGFKWRYVIRMRYGNIVSHPEDILQCPDELSHPDDLGIKIYIHLLYMYQCPSNFTMDYIASSDKCLTFHCHILRTLILKFQQLPDIHIQCICIYLMFCCSNPRVILAFKVLEKRNSLVVVGIFRDIILFQIIAP